MQKNKDEKHLAKALEKAAKIICTLKLGLCPVREDNFSGCPCVCHEDIQPWQCWVSYLRKEAAESPSDNRSYTV